MDFPLSLCKDWELVLSLKFYSKNFKTFSKKNYFIDQVLIKLISISISNFVLAQLSNFLYTILVETKYSTILQTFNKLLIISFCIKLSLDFNFISTLVSNIFFIYLNTKFQLYEFLYQSCIFKITQLHFFSSKLILQKPKFCP